MFILFGSDSIALYHHSEHWYDQKAVWSVGGVSGRLVICNSREVVIAIVGRCETFRLSI
jgi:hypothetical protein